MYPPGIRVVKVSGRGNVGNTGTVVLPPHWRLSILPCDIRDGYDILVQHDQASENMHGVWYPPGKMLKGKSTQWRPINPDTDPQFQEQPKELETI